MDEEATALAVLAKRRFDRSSQEVELLAAWLTANCCPFFSSMRQDAVQQLCSHVGHLQVAALQPVYTQGQVGDCMYVVAKGYCSVLKHPDIKTSSASSDGSPSSSSSRHGTHSHPVSRRVTLEMQAQQFALAVGGVSTGAAGSRRGTAEVMGSAGQAAVLGVNSSSAAASRRVSGAVFAGAAGQQQGLTAGSRRVTTEQLVQQQLAESTQLGWVSRGDSFGEAALVNPAQQRPVSVVAGDEGAVLLVLDRASFNRLQQQAREGGVLAAAAVQAVLAAACRPILKVGGRARSAEEVETLAELFSGLEAFKCMPQPVRTRLAKACQGMQAPAGAVVFEEDDKGDAMYVVVSGALQVRARPLALQPSTAAASAAAAAQTQQGGPEGLATAQADLESSTAAGAGSGSGQQQGAGAHHMRATTDAVCAAGTAAAGGGFGSCAGARGQQLRGGSRRTTWEGVAFTAKEQGRLEAVRAALQAERQQEASSPVVQDKGSARGQGQLVERDSLYWTAKYLQASSAASAAEPQWGLEGGMTPLAAVFASKWRQQVHQQAVQHHAQAAAAQEEAADSKAYAAMEEMLGKAAAKAWKAARDNAAGLAATATATAASGSPTSGNSSPGGSQPSPSGAALNTAGVTDDAAVAAATVVAGGSSAPRSPDTSTPSSPGPAGLSAAHTSDLPLGSPTSAPAAAQESSEGPLVPCTPRTAAAAAAQLLAAAAAASDPVEAVKLHLAALGVKDPADVSRSLMAEVGARSSLEGLLGAVAQLLERRGLPRRLSRKGSLRITRELNKRMLAGASWKGYNGSGSSSQGGSFRQHAQQQQQQDALNAAADAGPLLPQARGAVANGRPLRQRTSGDGDESLVSDLATEATGLSSCASGWQSSLDTSDAASMAGGLGMEDSMEGSLLGSVDLAASTDTGGLGCFKTAGGGGAGVAAAGCAALGPCGCGCHQHNGAEAAAAAECTCCRRAGVAQQQQQLLAPLQLPGGVAASRADAGAGCYTARFGPVIRTLGTGDSFGELALLQCSAVRTATVVVAPEATAPEAQPAGQSAAGGSSGSSSGGGGALLIKISRSCYDSTVRALQVAALEELLGFLGSLPAFSGLGREALTALAVFIRPLHAQPGQVLAVAGQPADALVIIQSGDVKLLCPPSSVAAEPLLPALGRSSSFNSNGGSSSTGASKQAGGSRRTSGTQQPQATLLGRQLSRSSNSFNASHDSGSSSAGGGGLGAQLTAQQQLSGVQLAVLGPGSMLGENVLGYNPEEDPVAAVAAASGRRARQAALAAAAALTHHATAVAAAPCKLLVLQAEDLRRFGRRVRGPLAEAAAARRDWLQQRIAAVQVPHPASSGPGRAQGAAGQGAAGYSASGGAGVSQPSPPVHGLGSRAAVSGGLWQATHSGSGGAAGSSTRASGGSGSNYSSNSSSSSVGAGSLAGVGLWPGLANLLAPMGSASAAAAAKMRRSSPGAAAAASRLQWQQQQWQQGAYGELLLERPQLAAQAPMGRGDVARLRQLVPGMQPPCVSEMAAAGRPFPAGLLAAGEASVAGGGGKGLQQLLLSTSADSNYQHRQHLQVQVAGGEAAAATLVGSPKWSVGPGGRVLPAAAVAAAVGGRKVATTMVPAAGSGRRGPMGQLLEQDSQGLEV